jgi:hypothetical protein
MTYKRRCTIRTLENNDLILKIPIFWTLKKFNRRFVVVHRLHMQSRRVRQARSQHEQSNEPAG